MCGLIGLAGNFNKDLLFSMMKSIKHRGEDSSGFGLFNGDSHYIVDNFDFENNDSIPEDNFSLGLGHNLLSIFNLINSDGEISDNLNENKQPIYRGDLVLIFNGELYNFNKLELFLKDKYNENINKKEPESNYFFENLYKESKSDSQLLHNLLSYYYGLTNADLLESVKKTIAKLDGDYSFAVYDKKNNDLAVCRDSIGVKPLYYGKTTNEDNNLKNSDNEKNTSLFAFASERKALWKIGIKNKDIKDLKPGSILYNWEIVDIEDDLINNIISTDFNQIRNSYSNYNEYLSAKDSYEVYKELLTDDLRSAVEKRVENLVNLGLIFSAGVDSTILALLLKEIQQKREKQIENGENIKPLNIKLYSVGVSNSQDLKFSQKMADELGLELKSVIINEDTVKDNLKDVLIAIEDNNIMKIGVGMTIFLASKAIKEDNINVAISGQGADELFGGYNRYLKHFEENSLFDAYFNLDEEIYHDIANMYHVNLERDDAVAMANGVELRVPFLDKEIIKLALDIPGKFKIRNSEDLLRKHILRDLALDIGVPEYIANRPKKAAQYGSGINKILKKKVLKSVDLDELFLSIQN